MDIWEILKLESTRDKKAIKRAYAAQLKKIKPEFDPQAFYQLRLAYEEALKLTDNEPARYLEPLFALRKMHTPPAMLGVKTVSAFRHDALDYDLMYKWVGKIINALKHSEALANHYFSRALRQEEMENIEFKNRFGDLLLRRIAAVSPFPYQLVQHMDEAFHWSDRVSQVGGKANLHMRHVVKRISAHRYLRKLLQDAGGGVLGYLDRLVLETLTKPVDLKRYAWMVRSRTVVERIDYWLQEFQLRHPEVLQYELPDATLQWWRHARGEIYIQGFHFIVSLFVAIVSTRFLAHAQSDFLLGVLIFPVSFLLLVGTDYVRFLWALQWRQLFESRWKKLNPANNRSAPYRFLWSVVLVISMLAGKWLSPIGTIVAMTFFYAMVMRAVKTPIVWIASFLAYASLLLLEWQIQSYSTHGMQNAIVHYFLAAAVGTFHVLGSYLIFLSAVLFYTSLLMILQSRIKFAGIHRFLKTPS